MKSKRVVSDGVAYEATSILRACMTSGTGTRARLDDGRPEAGKTGTAENFGNAWFCGYTPDIATCVWVGYRSINKPLVNIEGIGEVFGGTIPAEIWKDFMTTATRRLPRTTGRSPSIRWSTRSSMRRPRSATTRAPPAPPAPDEKKKPGKKPKAPRRADDAVVIAPQNG